MKMNAPDLRNADNSTYNSPDDPRITKIGRLIRKTSIDETPQIFNILKGDMSFIGPRPITVNRPLEEYDEKRRIRLLVRPGVTGYSQAYFRNSISQEEKLQYDADYAQHVTFLGDVKIVLKTIDTVLHRKNIYIKKEKSEHGLSHAPFLYIESKYYNRFLPERTASQQTCHANDNR
jgi:lipopolysaccharide/colanic/teichoic acid biosynthesis glycosyltransferase